MSTFNYTDIEGDELEAFAPATGVTTFAAVLASTSHDGDWVSVGLTADAARDLAAKLTEWAGEEEPAVPTFKVGDRVTVTEPNRCSRLRVGDVGTLVRVWPACHPDHDTAYRVKLVDGTEGTAYGVEHYTPDYAALAAAFKPGDLAIVSDYPSTRTDGTGYVDKRFAGKAVNVITREDANDDYFDDWPEVVPVALGNGDAQFVHVAHLTRVEAVKW